MLPISIHAAQEGCDGKCLKTCPLLKDFNPRSPRGLRLERLAIGGARYTISIHAAQEGCDTCDV